MFTTKVKFVATNISTNGTINRPSESINEEDFVAVVLIVFNI